MGEVSTIGLDITKSVFQVHGVDDDGTVVVRKRVSRAKVLEFFSTLPSCVVGIEACPSAHHCELFKIIADEKDGRIPAAARFSLDVLARQHAAIAAEIGAIEKRIHAWHRSSEESRRLEQIPGVGPIVATALVSEVGDWKEFSSGRSLAAWIGLVPKQHSTGGKERLGRISKQGNRYLRWLLITGAMAVIRYARQHGTRRLWLAHIMERPAVQGRRCCACQ